MGSEVLHNLPDSGPSGGARSTFTATVKGEDNASMDWHPCAADSLRFPSFDLPDF
jgi:hypothetical protein